MAAKRVVILSDLHCGHRAGLTPPGWQLKPVEDEPLRMKWVNLQRECWKWYIREISRLRPIDVLIVNGDCIDGTGTRSGGTELITTDRNEQVNMACKCLQAAKTKNVYIVRGTPYHSGEQEDMEDLIKSLLPAQKIGDHEWYTINGVVFDVKHKIGASSIPHGQATSLLRDNLWNALWHEYDEQPRADILIRAHVHYHLHVGGMRNGRPWLAMILPALQGMGSKFGAKGCSVHVDFGFVHFDIDGKGNFQWQSHVGQLQRQKAQALVL